MDSDDEEALAALLEEEADADVQEEEHLMVIAALAGLLVSNEKPQRGGLVLGRMKAKNRHRLEGYCMLYYLARRVMKYVFLFVELYNLY